VKLNYLIKEKLSKNIGQCTDGFSVIMNLPSTISDECKIFRIQMS